MIKNWQKFNEAYDEDLIKFTREESQAFNDYYKYKVINSLDKKPFLELLNQFIEIVNDEFDSDIKLNFDDIYFALIEPIENFTGSTTPNNYLNVDNSSKIWEMLKYQNYKPGFVVKLKLPFDEELKNSRWTNYYQKVLDNINKIPNTQIAVYIDKPTKSHTRHQISNIPLYVFLRYEDFKFKDPFSKQNVISFLEEHPKHINALYKWADKDEIFDFLIDNPEVKKNLKGQNLLDFTKKYKSINDPQRSQMESENQMYIFIARPTFKEQPDGNYKKDIEIENLVPIDPYDSKDAYALSMMKLRARMQSNNSEVYCIWLPKDDFEKDDLRKINDDSMTYLRNLIDQKKQKV